MFVAVRATAAACVNWGLVAKIDTDEAFMPVYQLRNRN
jgi:hypothetical protein